MLVQEPSMQEVLARARRLGRRTVVGGPACTTSPELFGAADTVFMGEAEGREGELRRAIEGAPGAPRLLPAPATRPAMALAPVPRFDLLALDRYRSMAIQTSRGCPFTCEFCDIVVMFGQVPRVKSPAQVVAELESLHGLGYRGDIFIVDDNFIGNKKAVRPILQELARWQHGARRPFSFYTEASINLAADKALLQAMKDASFTGVFIGIETPQPETLKKAGKLQNVRVDLPAAIDTLTRAGLEVMGGFIVGFDGDGAAAFDAQRELLRDAPIPIAMVGLLTAFPGTPLWKRLEREGRLRRRTPGDAFDRPNFHTTMAEGELLESYSALLGELYSAEGYHRRSMALVERIGAPERPAQLRAVDVVVAVGAVVRLGMLGPRRADFWRLMKHGVGRGVHATRAAIASAVMGEHLIRYTEEVVRPRIERALADVRADEQAASARGWRQPAEQMAAQA
jgi:radical SAM superfamily enzyme YgiQ (UPF0313 family)